MSHKTITMPIHGGPAESAALWGSAVEVFNEEQVRQFIFDEIAKFDIDGKSVCIPIPDGTRSGPMG